MREYKFKLIGNSVVDDNQNVEVVGQQSLYVMNLNEKIEMKQNFFAFYRIVTTGTKSICLIDKRRSYKTATADRKLIAIYGQLNVSNVKLKQKRET